MASKIENAPSRVWRTFLVGFRETKTNIRNFPRSMREKGDTGINQAQQYLKAFYENHSATVNMVFTDGDTPILGPRVTSGWWFTIYGFETNIGSWVLKIGHKHPPMDGYLAPSDKRFAAWYNEGLGIQNEIFSSRLPYLILPQEVAHLSCGEEATTLVVQPYVSHDRNSLKEFKALPPSRQQNIIREYELLIELAKGMKQKHGLQIDLFGDIVSRNSNLVIAKRDGEAHLVLLDNGPIDFRNPAPVINSLATGVAVLRAHSEKKLFQIIYRNGKNAREEKV